MTAISKTVRWLFWDVDVDSIDLERDEVYVLARVLERGRLADVKWAMDTYGLDRIRRFFEKQAHPGVSRRTVSFWKAVFGTEGETWPTPDSLRTNNSIPWP